MAGVASGLAMDEPYFPLLFQGLALLQNAPGFIGGKEPDWAGLATQLGLDGLYFANAGLGLSEGARPLLFNFAHKYSMYQTYAVYAGLREELAGEIHDGYAGYPLGELLLSPLDLHNYESWTVWGYLGSLALFELASLASSSQADAVWTTGRSFIGSAEFPVYLGIPLILALQVPNFIATGVGEESLYRGVYYEELKRRLGLWPAKSLDSLYFTLSHIPQKLASGVPLDLGRELRNSALSIGQTMWLQYIYDAGGLKEAVAAHAMSDIVVFFLDWMLQAGVPNTAGFSINDRVLSIGLRL
jgi:membrane protease YdiL (CAAX protease family)